jgi:hypothetical protein
LTSGGIDEHINYFIVLDALYGERVASGRRLSIGSIKMDDPKPAGSPFAGFLLTDADAGRCTDYGVLCAPIAAIRQVITI